MERIRYDEKVVVKKITKLRSWDKTEDTESVKFIPDHELPEHTVKVGIFLDAVQGYEEYKDPFNIFINKAPKVRISVYGFDDIIIVESFDYFDAMMEEFLKRQQEDGQANTKST